MLQPHAEIHEEHAEAEAVDLVLVLLSHLVRVRLSVAGGLPHDFLSLQSKIIVRLQSHEQDLAREEAAASVLLLDSLLVINI